MPQEKVTALVQMLESHLPWFYALILSLWGGLVQYAQRVREGQPWSWRDVVLDLIICSFAGLLAFFLCQAFGIYGWQQAIIIAISAHAGARAIGRIGKLADKILGEKI